MELSSLEGRPERTFSILWFGSISMSQTIKVFCTGKQKVVSVNLLYLDGLQ